MNELVPLFTWKSKIIELACAQIFLGRNDCLETYNYPLLSPEDIFEKLSICLKHTSKFPSTKNVQSINTEKGQYRFNRLPFGAKVAPGIFKQIMDTLLNDIDFAIAYLEDILIKSESQEQYVKHDKDVFEKIKQHFET